jgi:hypothetical protein
MAYKQRWLGYFEQFDTNHDGFIEPSDAVVVAQVFFVLFLFCFYFILFYF